MHDPLQSYATMSSPYGAANLGGLNPLGIPYNPQISNINPLAGIHPLAAATLGLSQMAPQGYGPYQAQNFIHPQHLQLASALAQQAAIPQQVFGQYGPGISPVAGLYNPMAALLSNPFIAAALQSQYGAQQFSQQPHYSQFGVGGGSQFGQPGVLGGIGAPLAPQSWVGQGGQLGGGQGFGQINPLLAQLSARAFQGQGLSPWGYQ
jgi:hypothetical protein